MAPYNPILDLVSDDALLESRASDDPELPYPVIVPGLDDIVIVIEQEPESPEDKK